MWRGTLEDIYPHDHPTIFIDAHNARNQQNLEPRARRIKGYCKSICSLVWELRFDKTTISAFVCMVHFLFTATLLWSSSVEAHSIDTFEYVISGFVAFGQAFSVTLPVFALRTYVSAKYTYESGADQLKRAKSGSIVAKSRVLASNQSIFSNGLVNAMICLSILVQFILSVMFPTFYIDSYKKLIEFMYQCEADECGANPFFIINELICGLFVGMTLLNAIFLVIAVSCHEDPKTFSFADVSRLINPCLWPLIALTLFVETRVVYVQHSNTQDMVNYVVMGVHGIFIVLMVVLLVIFTHLHTTKIKGDIETLYSYNSFPRSLGIEAVLLALFNGLSMLFLTSNHNSSIARQWVVYAFNVVETLIIYYLLQVQRHTKFAEKLGSSTKYTLAIVCIRIISFINLYDYFYVFIFQTSQFLSLLTNEHSDDLYHRIAFSFSFAISQFNFWTLSETCNFLTEYEKQRRGDDRSCTASEISIWRRKDRQEQELSVHAGSMQSQRARLLDRERDDASESVARYAEYEHMKAK